MEPKIFGIEQCGARTVITTSGIIHDIGPNSTGGINSNDTEGSVSFIAGGKEYCMRTSANSVWALLLSGVIVTAKM